MVQSSYPCHCAPLQLSRLTNLRALEGVRSPPDCEAAWSGITALSGLRSLQLEECEPAVPSWLPQLTQLHQLAISGDMALEEDGEDEADAAAAARLDAALAPLRGLTCLVLNLVSLTRLPPAVAQLPLQRLLLHTGWGPEPLPCPCPMLASLRWLGLQWQVRCGCREQPLCASECAPIARMPCRGACSAAAAHAVFRACSPGAGGSLPFCTCNLSNRPLRFPLPLR